MSKHMEGSLASVSENHVVAVRILSSGAGWTVQTLTPEWAIDMEIFDNFGDARTYLEDLTKKLRHQ